VSNATIMAMMKSGEIPNGTYMRLGRVFRYDLEKIEQALLTRAGLAEDVDSPVQEQPPVQYEFDFGDAEVIDENPYA
jgi:hypothetical protein